MFQRPNPVHIDQVRFSKITVPPKTVGHFLLNATLCQVEYALKTASKGDLVLVYIENSSVWVNELGTVKDKYPDVDYRISVLPTMSHTRDLLQDLVKRSVLNYTLS